MAELCGLSSECNCSIITSVFSLRHILSIYQYEHCMSRHNGLDTQADQSIVGLSRQVASVLSEVQENCGEIIVGPDKTYDRMEMQGYEVKTRREQNGVKLDRI